MSWWWRKRRDEDLERELRSHLDLEAEEQQERGLPPEEARYRAQRALGNVTRVKEDTRSAWGWTWLETIWQDLSYATRTLWKNPGFAAAAVFTLALGIGANTAMFSVVDAVLLKPLPFPEPYRLVRIWGDIVRQQASLVALRDGSQTTKYAAYSDNTEFNFTGNGDPQRLAGSIVTANLFLVLRQKPFIGRVFKAGEDSPGSAAVSLLSYAVWKNKFRGDPGIINRLVTIDDVDRQVIGIMPPGFAFPSSETEIWLPTSIDPRNVGRYWWTYNLNIIGRLREGVTTPEAEAELHTFIPRIRDSFPWKMWPNWGQKARLVDLQETLVGSVRVRLLILLAAVALVLLIACANVANLLLARSKARQKELSVRSALGASRTRLVRQLLTESFLIAVMGAAVGLGLAFVIGGVVRNALPAGVAQMGGEYLDLRILGFTGLLALGTGFGFGILPALRCSQTDVQSGLKSEDRTMSGIRGWRRLSTLLVTLEIAVGVVVVIGAGLLGRSFWALVHVHPGFQANGRLTALVTPNPSLCKVPANCFAFYQDLLQQVRALPSVLTAAAVNPLPLSGNANGAAVELEGHPVLPGHSAPALWVSAITPDYFAAMRIPVLSGRTFLDSDHEGTELVALVTASTAKRWWPGENPIGKRLRYVAENSSRTVVGVVGNTLDASLAGYPDWAEGHIYIPYRQSALRSLSMSIIITAAGDPLALIQPFRRIVSDFRQDVPVTELRTMDEVISQSVSTPRSTMWLLSSFAILALVLTLIGIYALIAYTVAQRTRELGIRMALGARPGDLLLGILRHSLTVALAGLAIGLAVAYSTVEVMSTLLFQVIPRDLETFIAAPVLLLILALIATYVPARRAMRVDPMVALRYE